MTPSKRIKIVKAHPDALKALRLRQSSSAQIAPGFKAKRALNLRAGKGRTLNDLQFVNVYLGHWAAADMSSIDTALSGAMTDPNLNHVIQQYFKVPLTTHFLGSSQRGDTSLTAGRTYNRDDVHATLAGLDLSRYDLTKTLVCLYLPAGVILDTHSASGVGDDKDSKDSSLEGLGGYHGSADVAGKEVLFAVAVYSASHAHKINGIPFWPDPWKNIVATMYHELNEARTDPDVEKSMRLNNDKLLGWYSPKGGEIGDIPMSEAGAHLELVMMEVPLVAGGTAPVQLMWSNEVGGPGMPY
jgi:hypothetical protein